jgi:hypothetical protein
VWVPRPKVGGLRAGVGVHTAFQKFRPARDAKFERGLERSGATGVKFALRGLVDAEAVRVAEGVKASGTLTTLQSEWVEVLQQAPQSPHVMRCTGAGNQIGDVGAAALAEGVNASRTLKVLGLSSGCGRVWLAGDGADLTWPPCSQ